MDNFEDHRKKYSEERKMEEEDLRDLQEKLKKSEEELLYQEAWRRLRKKPKYCFALSNDGILLLLVAGGWLAFALLRTGLVKLLFRGKESALQTVWIVIGMAVFAIAWIVISLILRRKLKEEAKALAASGEIKIEDLIPPMDMDYLPKPQKKRASEVEIEFPIESFETLSEMDFDLAQEEWDRLDQTVTEKFYRMPVIMQHFEAQAVFNVFIELRYEDTYPNYRLLRKTCDEIEKALSELCYNAETGMQDYKKTATDIVRVIVRNHFPGLKIKEVCIAVKQIA